MKLIIENGGSKLDWIVAGENKINTSKGINIFDSKDIIEKSIKDNFHFFKRIKNQSKSNFILLELPNSHKKKCSVFLQRLFRILR